MEHHQHFLRHEKKYLIGFIVTFFLINSIVLATSVLMEQKAAGSWPAAFALWEPFAWEFSSSFMMAVLIPFVAWVIDSGKFSWVNLWANLLNFILFSVLFSAIHVAGMVAIRELIYWLMGSDYRFGSWSVGFVYEYRKDAISFFLLLIIIQGYRSIVLRLRGEASLVQQGEDDPQRSDRILVKKLGAEFIVKLDDIQWVESAGNYVNLHLGDRVYPVRNTMEKFMNEMNERDFARTHRSYGVSLDFVQAIEAPPGQSGEVLLKNGRRLPLSKRHNAGLRSRLSV